MPAMQRYAVPDRALPVSAGLCERTLSLPIYPEMEDAAVDRVCDAVLAALGSNSA